MEKSHYDIYYVSQGGKIILYCIILTSIMLWALLPYFLGLTHPLWIVAVVIIGIGFSLYILPRKLAYRVQINLDNEQISIIYHHQAFLQGRKLNQELRLKDIRFLKRYGIMGKNGFYNVEICASNSTINLMTTSILPKHSEFRLRQLAEALEAQLIANDCAFEVVGEEFYWQKKSIKYQVYLGQVILVALGIYLPLYLLDQNANDSLWWALGGYYIGVVLFGLKYLRKVIEYN